MKYWEITVLHILVNNIEQLNSVLGLGAEYISRIYIENTIDINTIPNNMFSGIEIFLAGPYVFRDKDIKLFTDKLKSFKYDGILVRDMETLCYLDDNFSIYGSYKIVTDNSIYLINNSSYDFVDSVENLSIDECYNSFELNMNEIKHISCDKIRSSVVYGHIPMMISANCTQKTLSNCVKNTGISSITDRKNISFPIYRNCDYCYNVIYNSVVLSLHSYVEKLASLGNLRIDFLDEDSKTCNKVILYFESLMSSYSEPFYKDFTTGHIKRGIE